MFSSFSTNARGCNVTATYRAYKRGALLVTLASPKFHPTCIPVTVSTNLNYFDV